MSANDIRQEVLFQGTPHEIYELLLDSEKLSAFTGQPAAVSRVVGQVGSAYGGNLVFINRELVPDRRIVQDWRANWEHWPEDEWSRTTFELVPEQDSTRLIFTQAGAPDVYREEMVEGWSLYYWEPMRRYLEQQH